MLRVDLNADVGEGMGNDAALMPHITSANIACGGHAGDVTTMRDTLLLAAAHGVAAGAHPGYPDAANFGRVSISLTPGEIYEAVSHQIAALMAIARPAGVALTHVKPHGALYNDAARDDRAARAIVRAVYDTDPELLLYGLAGSVLITEAERIGLRAVAEAFADRGYQCDGTLIPRGVAGALIEDPATAGQRVVHMVTRREVPCSLSADSGAAGGTRTLRVHADSICIHGDGANAVAIAGEVRRALSAAHVLVCAPQRA